MTGYHRRAVPVASGELVTGVWEAGEDPQCTVLAIHGVTASHLAWRAVAERLPAATRLVAPDLRGRGDSAELPGPYGMAAHTADCVAVLAALGVPDAVVVGHSMGGFVALALADAYPQRVRRLVFVDGGPPLPPPVLPPGADDPQERLAAVIGPAAARLEMRFPTRAAYRDFWRGHPAFRQWSPAIEEYVDYDLTGAEPTLRSKVSRAAVAADTVDMYDGGALPAAWHRLRHPAQFLGAERGLLDEPPPLYPDLAPIAARMPARTILGTNHYSILFAESGAAAVAAALARDSDKERP
jgi:lipase